MANTTIQLKKSATPSATPSALAFGELAINYADGKLFYKAANGSIYSITADPFYFSTINANNTLVIADVTEDILSIVPGDFITITGDAINDRITIGANVKTVYDVANAAFEYANNLTVTGASLHVDASPPVSPTQGDLWWDTELGRLFLYYDDGTSVQWVEASPSGGITENGGNSQVANDAYVVANAAFDKANAANVLAYNTGIGANAYADFVGAAGNTYTSTIYGYVNTSMGFANQSGVIANSAFGAANQAGVIANSAFGRANGSATNAAAAFGFANAVATNAAAAFGFANGVATNAAAAFGSANAVGITANNIGLVANAAFGSANAVGITTNTIGSVANSAFDKANSANVLAYNTGIGANNYANASFYTIANGEAAFAKANAALANTTGTFAGDLTVTGNVNAKILASSNGFIDLGPGSRPAYLEGRIYYDDIDKSLTVFNNESGFVLPIGQKEFVKVLNDSGITINRGQPVYATGFHSTSHHHLTVALADASDPAKYDVVGLAGHDIINGDHGYIITRGWIGGFDTSGLTQGERFHLGFAAPGTLVTVSPEYPNYPFDVGYCVVSNTTNGFLYVDRQSHTQESLRILTSARIGGDMTVEGDFTVLGTQTVTSTTSLSVGTQYIYLSAGDSIPNSNITFTGAGLNDATFRGHYEGTGTTNFYVKITEANATGDYFSLSYDNFSTTVTSNTLILYQTNQLLSNGISVYFQANTGHTIGNKWNASVTAVSSDSGFVTNHTDPGRYTHAGMFRDATDGTFKFFNTYDAEPAGNIDIANNTFSLGNVEVLKITAAQIYAGATEIGSLVPSISTVANAAFDGANQSGVIANSAFGGANQSGVIANGAFGGANQAGVIANSAFGAANQSGVIANSAFGFANGVSTNTTAAFGFANGVSTNTTAAFGFANGVSTNTTAAFGAANQSGVIANGAFDAANQAGVIANSAFGSANNRLANTSGINFNGTLHFPSGCVAIGIASTNYPLTIVTPGVTPLAGLTGALATAEGTVNGTNQFNLRNAGTGSASSSDYVATSNDGSETTNFIDLGINNSGYNAPAFWTINGPRDGYLYMPDGNLSIGIANTTSSIKFINFFVGGALAADEVMRIQDSAGGANVGIGRTNPSYKLDVVGTINASNVLVNQVPVVANATTTIFDGTANNAEFLGSLPAANVATATITYIIDGGGATISTGEKGYIEIPFGCSINVATILLDQTGSINVTIQKDTYANFPPTAADTINSAGFTVVTTNKNQIAGTLITNRIINAGDILAYNVTSVTSATRATISLKVNKT